MTDTHMPTRPGCVLTLPEIAFIVLHTKQIAANLATITALSWRESAGGQTDAYRPTRLNPLGGEDRGIVQFNSDAFSWLSDDWCYHPLLAMSALGVVSKGGLELGPWNIGPRHYGSVERTDLDLAAAAFAVENPANPYWKLFGVNVDLFAIRTHERMVPVDLRSVLPRPPWPTTIAPLPVTSNYGQQGPQVTALQKRLADEGLFPREKVVSYYGTLTRSTILTLQSNLRVPLTGNFDFVTRDAWASQLTYLLSRQDPSRAWNR